jgi:orotidine-5'-phosphate decarboxylase
VEDEEASASAASSSASNRRETEESDGIAAVGFSERFLQLSSQRSPFCLGLDPSASLLAAWGLEDSVSGLQEFCDRVLGVALGMVGAVKAQSAFFERFGHQGVRILEEMLGAIRAEGVLAILDAKRGDVGSTMEAYAQAMLSPVGCSAVPLADAVTASPYLGVDALEPLFRLAGALGSYVFVVAASSNPEGLATQGAVGESGEKVVEGVCARIAHWAQATDSAESRGGAVGAVVGGTSPLAPVAIRRLEGVLVLAPGLGAQGGTPEQFLAALGAAKGRIIPVAARSVLRAGPDPARLTDALRAHIEMAWQLR